MANIKVRIVPNPLYGGEGSQVVHPYMGEVVYRGTLDAVRYSLGGEDQSLLFKDAAGETLSEATFLGGDELGQQFRYRLATPPTDATHGKLALTSRGKDTPEKNPKTMSVNVGYFLPPAPTVVLASINGDEAAVETREASWLKPDAGMTFDAWFDTVGGAPTLEAVADDTCDWWFEKGGVRHEGQMTLANGGLWNKGDDELLMSVPVDESALLDVGDVVHYHAVLHGGVAGSRPQVFDFTSTVREE